MAGDFLVGRGWASRRHRTHSTHLPVVASRRNRRRCFCSIVGFMLLVRLESKEKQRGLVHPLGIRLGKELRGRASYLYSEVHKSCCKEQNNFSIGLDRRRRFTLTGIWGGLREFSLSNNGARVTQILRLMSFAWPPRMWENVSAFLVWVFVLMGGY